MFGLFKETVTGNQWYRKLILSYGDDINKEFVEKLSPFQLTIIKSDSENYGHKSSTKILTAKTNNTEFTIKKERQDIKNMWHKFLISKGVCDWSL